MEGNRRECIVSPSITVKLPWVKAVIHQQKEWACHSQPQGLKQLDLVRLPEANEAYSCLCESKPEDLPASLAEPLSIIWAGSGSYSDVIYITIYTKLPTSASQTCPMPAESDPKGRSKECPRIPHKIFKLKIFKHGSEKAKLLVVGSQ